MTASSNDAADIASFTPIRNTFGSSDQAKTDTTKILAKLTGSDFEYWVRKEKVVIGRNSSNGKVDVNIESSSYVSRKHLQILFERGRFFLNCVGKNGIFVNGQFQRLGANPLPLDKACVIRFPSTTIQLQFDPNPQNHINGDPVHLEKVEGFPAISSVPLTNSQVRTTNTHLSVSTALVNKSLSPINSLNVSKENKHEFSSPSLKFIIPKDPRGFLSAPPSPTGTISAVNSCPASPRSGTLHLSNQNNNIAENLSAAASAIAVLEKPDDKFSGGDGIDSKPPYSYAQLIIQAISSAPNRQLTLSGIYAHITKHYPYYRTADKGWQNSIRHNLSLNRYFVKVPRSQEESGKGSFWRVDPDSEKKLVEQAWRKRRQRAVPCFGSTLASGISTITRSAPASPDHSNPVSPVPALQNTIRASHEDHHSNTIASDSDGKVQLVKFTPRYAQSAPGSPAGLQHSVVMAQVSENYSASNHHHSSQPTATILAPASTIPLSDINTSKVMLSLHPVNSQSSATSNALNQSRLQTTLVQDRSNLTSVEIPTALLNTSKMLPGIQSPSTAAVNLSTVATLTPTHHRQLLQQGQSLPQQVVMMPSSQTSQHQPIPINLGTIVAGPNSIVTPGLPFVLPINQQYIVKRINEESNETSAKKVKIEENASSEASIAKTCD